jgi:hypothetical protein
MSDGAFSFKLEALNTLATSFAEDLRCSVKFRFRDREGTGLSLWLCALPLGQFEKFSLLNCDAHF